MSATVGQTGFVVTSRSPEESGKLGKWIGELLEPGDLILFHGDLGAGKTTMIRAIARGMGVPHEEPVTSPSFALVHEYRGRCLLYHLDCYRLSGPGEIEEAGILEYIEARDAVCVVEWSERLGHLRPDQRLEIDLELLPLGEEEARKIGLTGYGRKWYGRLSSLQRQIAASGLQMRDALIRPDPVSGSDS